MILSAVKIFVVLFLMCLFLYGTSCLSRKQILQPEILRKIVHSGLGLTCLSFPWLFHSIVELLFLLAGVIGVLLTMRLNQKVKEFLGLGLFAVERDSIGDLLFAIAVLLLFHYAAHQSILYILPLLILTLSDSAAALIGTRFGRHSFDITEGQKSWEGSLAFFLVTAVLSFSTLYFLTSLNFVQIFCITMILAFVGAMVEAVSWHGLDNLFVPIGLFLLLKSLVEQTALALVLTLFALVALILLAQKFSTLSRLTTHALLGALLTAFFFWEVGGMSWLLVVLIIFFTHVIFSCMQNDNYEYGLEAVLGVVISGIPWIFIAKQQLFPYAYYLFVLTMAINLQIIILSRIKFQSGQPSEYSMVVVTAIACAWIFFPALLLEYPISPRNIGIFLSGLFIMISGGVFFQVRSYPQYNLSRWLVQGIYASTGSVLGLILVSLFLWQR